jgi:hypothetical protein
MYTGRRTLAARLGTYICAASEASVTWMNYWKLMTTILTNPSKKIQSCKKNKIEASGTRTQDIGCRCAGRYRNPLDDVAIPLRHRFLFEN